MMDKLSLIAGIFFGFLIGLVLIGPIKYNDGMRDGKRTVVEAIEKQNKNNVTLKAKTDAEIDDMSATDLCIYLGGLPNDCHE